MPGTALKPLSIKLHPCPLLVLLLASASIFPSAAVGEFPGNASWIASASASSSLPIFRREFTVGKPVSKAVLRISGLGQFEAHINGSNVTDAVLTPGWTDYRKHIVYDTYDVTALMRSGPNVIGVLLGNGMYNVQEIAGRYTKFAGSFGSPKLIAELVITFTDGTTQAVVTDRDWQSSAGPITFSSIYGGEDYDARLNQAGWDKPRFSAKGWSPTILADTPAATLIPESIPPIQPFQTYLPVRITHPQPGISVYDLGENFAGWPEIEARGQRGARIKLLPGELLDAHGRVTQRSANAYPNSEIAFNYVLNGSNLEHWSPRFSYTGFRYLEVATSAAHPVKIIRIAGRFLHDAVHIDGSFTSSSQLLNQIHLLINRAMLSNMVSVLTDCPHREKLGWLEQTHLAGASLMYNYGLGSLYAKMAGDMQDAQLTSGLVPDIAPEYPVFEEGFRDSPEWGAAVVLSPWTAYQFYGDVEPLRAHYGSMKKYAAYLHSRLQNGLLSYGLGDWYDIGPGEPGESQLTAKGITATAIYFQMLIALQHIAILLDHPDDASQFTQESESIKAAFNAAFFHAETGQYDRGSQTANAMPLVVGLVPQPHRATVLANLITDIHRHGNHVTAGDIGFHYVVRALTDNGRSDVLYEMLSRTDKPSYGDQLAHGATALTEAWDANPASSQNHFMLGHAEEWFYRGLAGIDVDLSRDHDTRIRIQPAIVGDMKHVSAGYQSRIGKIGSAWTRSGNHLTMDIVIPAGSHATLVFPAGRTESIRLHGSQLTESASIHSIHRMDGKITCIVAGGTYSFVISMTPGKSE